MNDENEIDPNATQSEAHQEDANEPTQIADDDLVIQPSDAGAKTESQSPEEEIEKLKSDVADAEKRILMAHADMENYRKRARRDMQEQVRYAALPLMNELLDAVDNLSRAVQSYQQDPNGDGLAEGVNMVAQQITKTLETHGCKKIDAVGHPFDPNLHQALQMQPSDEHPANTVMMDLRPGFQLHDRVIRPTQVFVSTGPAEKSDEAGE